MGYIFCVLGASSSGKDTIVNYFLNLEGNPYQLKAGCPYTTRPKREGEQEGREYHFVSKETRNWMKEHAMIIEERVYHTVYGDWYYFTGIDTFDLEHSNYMMPCVLPMYTSYQAYFGSEIVVPIYIKIDAYTRFKRAWKRENLEQNPKYDELRRRFKADEIDFRKENLDLLGISPECTCDNNGSLEATVEKVKSIMKKYQS